MRERLVVAFVGLAANVVSVVARGMAADRVPWGNMYEYSSLLALLVVAGYLLIVEGYYKIRTLGGFVLMFAIMRVPTRARRPIVWFFTFFCGSFYVLYYLWPRPRTFRVRSDEGGSPVFAQPIIIPGLGERALATSFPGEFSGSLTVDSTMRFYSWEVNGVARVCRGQCWSFDAIAGFRGAGGRAEAGRSATASECAGGTPHLRGRRRGRCRQSAPFPWADRSRGRGAALGRVDSAAFPTTTPLARTAARAQSLTRRPAMWTECTASPPSQ